MNNKIILILATIVVIAGATVFVLSQTNKATTSTDSSMDMTGGEEMMGDDSMNMGSTHSADMSDEDMEHMVAEGGTFMVMAGQISPTVIYASPGQKIMIANHESYDLTLVLEDGSFETELVASGTDGSFMAPMEVGRYVYYNSEKPSIKGTLVVEE